MKSASHKLPAMLQTSEVKPQLEALLEVVADPSAGCPFSSALAASETPLVDVLMEINVNTLISVKDLSQSYHNRSHYRTTEQRRWDIEPLLCQGQRLQPRADS